MLNDRAHAAASAEMARAPTGRHHARTSLERAGRSYIVRQTGTGIEVTVEGAGLTLSSAEQAIVEGDFGWLGEEDELSRALPDAPIHLGDSVVPVARALKQRFFGAPDTVIEAADAHVEKISTDHIVFRVQATFVRTQESIFRNTIVGTITVRTSDGWISAWALDVAHSISTWRRCGQIGGHRQDVDQRVAVVLLRHRSMGSVLT